MRRLFTIILATFSFYLGTYNGQLALWKTGIDKPEAVYPYNISVYTKTDKYLLEKGIFCEKTIPISKVLEDYMS